MPISHPNVVAYDLDVDGAEVEHGGNRFTNETCRAIRAKSENMRFFRTEPFLNGNGSRQNSGSNHFFLTTC